MTCLHTCPKLGTYKTPQALNVGPRQCLSLPELILPSLNQYQDGRGRSWKILGTFQSHTAHLGTGPVLRPKMCILSYAVMCICQPANPKENEPTVNFHY